MRIPTNSNVAKCASKDQTRPVLAAPALVDVGGLGACVAATDSYKLVVVPVLEAEDDERGPLSLEAVKRAVKDEYAVIANREKDCTVTSAAGTLTERRVDGQFPDPGKLFPEGDGELGQFIVGLNPRFLLDLAEAMGAGTVSLAFVTNESGVPNPLRPMIVRPMNPARSSRSGGDIKDGRKGLLMPVRVLS